MVFGNILVIKLFMLELWSNITIFSHAFRKSSDYIPISPEKLCKPTN